MAIIKCIDCNHEISARALHCPNCGAPVLKPKLPQKSSVLKNLINFIGKILLFLIVVAIPFVSGYWVGVDKCKVLKNKIPETSILQSIGADACFERGMDKYNSGDYQSAITDYTEVIRLKANYAPAYYNRGLSKRKLGDTQGAQMDWLKAEELGYSPIIK